MPSIVDKSSVKMVCVDDFALRKRFSYGTVMINLENHRIVDMIPSRDTNDVCNWLKTFHNIEVISRDGAITYASAATNSHPDVIQISDRFHLIKGLSEVICKYIFREFPARVEIPLTESVTDEMKALYNTANRSLRIKFAHEKRREGLTISDIALLLHSSPKTIQKYLAIPEDQIPESKEIARERQHQLAIKQKEQEIKEAREMALAGYPIEQIASQMHRAHKTIQNYLNPDLSNFKSRTLENTGIFSVFGASALPFSLIFSLTGENKGKFFYTAPTTLSSSLAEVRLASLVAWA